MSAKGAWARKGGAQLFPQKAPASDKQQPSTSAKSVAPKPAVPKSANPKPANPKPVVNVEKTKVDQQPATKSVTEDVNADSLAAFFASEQKLSKSKGLRTIAEWNGYLTDLWERLRRDNVGCSASLKTIVRERFEEIVGWKGTEFVASQVVSPRQLEILFGVLLNHLSGAHNYESNSVVSTNVPLSVRTEEKKTRLPDLKVEVPKDTDEKPAKATGKSANHQHERKSRGRQSRGRNTNRSSSGPAAGNANSAMQYTGKVTRWGSQGFGFIKPDDGGEDLHVNSSDLVGEFNSLIVGRRVIFTKRFNERARKYKACRVSGEACTTTHSSRGGGQRRPRRRHHQRGGGGYGDGGGNGGGGNGGLNFGGNGVGNVSVGFNVGAAGYGGVPYGGVPYGGVPYTFGGFPGAGHFGYGGGVQIPLSPTGAPGYGSPPYGGMGYGGPPISPVSSGAPLISPVSPHPRLGGGENGPAPANAGVGAPNATGGGPAAAAGDDAAPPAAP